MLTATFAIDNEVRFRIAEDDEGEGSIRYGTRRGFDPISATITLSWVVNRNSEHLAPGHIGILQVRDGDATLTMPRAIVKHIAVTPAVKPKFTWKEFLKHFGAGIAFATLMDDPEHPANRHLRLRVKVEMIFEAIGIFENQSVITAG